MKVKYVPNPKDHWGNELLLEITQTSEDLMAIGVPTEEGTIRNLTSWFHCREFFNDYIYYYSGNILYEIYGFNLKPIANDIINHWEDMVLLVRVHNRKYSNRVLKEVTKKVEDLEKEALGEMFSTIELDDDRKHLIIKFNSFWKKNTYLFSLFTREVRWGYLIATKKYVELDRWDYNKLKSSERGTNLVNNWDIEKCTPIVYNNAVIQYIASLPNISSNNTSPSYIHERGYAWIFEHEYSNIKPYLQGGPEES